MQASRLKYPSETTSQMSDSNEVKETLSSPGVHQGWETKFRTSGNKKFFEQVFDEISAALGTAEGTTLLDAGCGSCWHAMRLADRGYDVTAIDYSDHVIREAKDRVESLGYQDKIMVQKNDLLDLSFEDESFDYVFCWGVLMHIPDIRRAISELSRVVKPGGKLVISEVNMNSVEIVASQRLRSWLGNSHITSRIKEEGIETWAETKSGRLLSRRANVPWMIREFAQHRFRLLKRKPGQFTEAYTRLTNTLALRLIHEFNYFWYRHVDLPGPACGNLIFMQKD